MGRLAKNVDYKKMVTKEITNYCRRYAKGFVEKAAELLSNKANTEMARFYVDYQPEKYTRTWNLWGNSFEHFLSINNTGYSEGINSSGVYEGGVILTPNKMDEYSGTKKGAKYAIFDYTWIRGLHGNPKKNTVKMVTSPSPWIELVRYYHSQDVRNQCVAAAEANAAHGNYKYIWY